MHEELISVEATSMALEAIAHIVPGDSLNAGQLERAWSAIRRAGNCGADIELLHHKLRQVICMKPDDYQAALSFMNEMIVD